MTNSKSSLSIDLSISMLLAAIAMVGAYIEFRTFLPVGIIALYWLILQLASIVNLLPVAGPILFYFIGHEWALPFLLSQTDIPMSGFWGLSLVFWGLFILGVLSNILIILIIIALARLK